MDKYLIRKPCTQDSSPVQDSLPVQNSSSSSKRICVDFNLENLHLDPRLQEKISSYHSNNHDEIRRFYLQKGHCQHVLHEYPLIDFFGKPCQFRSNWYVNRNWLEYNIEKDAIFSLYCYLFGQDVGKQGGRETFITKRFKLWNQKEKLSSHVGGVNNTHNQIFKKSEDLMKEKQHIRSVLIKKSNQDKIEYRVQLNAIVDCIRFLLCWGLTFRGHDESQGSIDKGNFLKLLQFLADHNESINEVLQKALKNYKFTHREIQKNIMNAIAHETSKWKMALILRYVNKKRIIIEQFLGIVHVASTTTLSLKYVVECLLCKYNLSLSNLRGQGYNETSNMQGDINGLKTLILKENKSTFYIHCFAYQLKLTLIAVIKNHINIAEFFYMVSNLATIV